MGKSHSFPTLKSWLVTAEEQKGFRVALVSRDDLLELTEIRIDIEYLALRKPIALGHVNWEVKILASYHGLSRLPMVISNGERRLNEDWERLRSLYHEALVAGCASPPLISFRTNFGNRTTRYRRLLVACTAEPCDIDAALARNADRACTLLSKYFRKTTEIVLESLEWQIDGEAE